MVYVGKIIPGKTFKTSSELMPLMELNHKFGKPISRSKLSSPNDE